jgi:glycosyltransferase involved in cell wall biosynthesis
MRILYFIGNLRSGGKERRLLELIKSITKDELNIKIMLVLIRNDIHYKDVSDHDIMIKYLIEKEEVKNPFSIYYHLVKIVKDFKPDIIHSWGSEETFYICSIATSRNIKLINSQITNAPKKINVFSKFGIQTKINFYFSDMILANSYMGLKSYGEENKKNSRVIHNGFNMARIESLKDSTIIRKQMNIKTKYVVCMVGAFVPRKDYTTYLFVAEKIIKERDDVTFLGVGNGEMLDCYRKKYKSNKKIILPGRISDVESIINASDICILMTNGDVHGEGISNSIMEYMALGKPVIASSSGGTSEIVQNKITGFVITNKSKNELESNILRLLKDKDLRENMGQLGKQRIIESFNIEAMTNSFIELYKETINEH